MRRPRLRFTIRSLLIGVALVGLDLAAAIETATPRGDWPRLGLEESPMRGGFRASDPRPEYGVACIYDGFFMKPTPETEATAKLRGLIHDPRREDDPEFGLPMERLIEVVRAPLPATPLQVWSPALAGASITLLVLITGASGRGTFSGESPPDGRVSPPRLRRVWSAARWVLIALALIALNLAGISHRPGFDLYAHDASRPADPAHAQWLDSLPRERLHREHVYSLRFVGHFSPGQRRSEVLPWQASSFCRKMEYADLFVGIPKVLNIEVDGTLVERCAMEFPASDYDSQTRLPEVIFEDSPYGEATIDFRSDGGIVGHAGPPGTVLSPPRTIRAPTHSFLEMRWAAIVSAAVTALLFVMVLRRLDSQQIRTLVVLLALAGLNAAAAFASYKIGEPPRLLSQTGIFLDSAAPGEEYYSDGSRVIYAKGRGGMPRRVERIESPHPPPTSLQIWWPVIASGSITLAVLGVLRLRHRGTRTLPVARFGDADRPMADPS